MLCVLRHVMHCDLKEPNTMITGADELQEPSIVVIDFGLADMMTSRRQTEAKEIISKDNIIDI